jgi:pimeloyl-ACP methyl ester carboxylesterase
MFRSTALTCTIVVAALAASACSRAPAGAGAVSPEDSSRAIIAVSDLIAIDPSVRSATALAKRITYASRSAEDALTHVTGSVFVPKGKPPEGGWQIVVFGHPVAGTSPDCAPSLSPTLLGASTTVQALVQAGYLVSVPDYQGLGNAAVENAAYNSTYYPYLDSTTAGYNMIDSVRAVRKLIPEASNVWAALGTSEGGQAAWAANELMDNYGVGLKLVGSASLSPITDINGLADAAEAGDLTKDQELALQAFLAALKKRYGNEFNLDDYRRGVVKDKWDLLSACDGSASEPRAKVADQITPDDLRPASPQAAATLRGYLQKTSLPQGVTQAPMLVIYGGQDALVPPAWTNQALYRACRMGDVIQITMQPDRGHNQVDPSTALGWLQERFKNSPPHNDCQSFTARHESSGRPAGPR